MDKKLSKNFSKYLYKDLSKMNLEISVMKLILQKKNKNEKILFRIIDKLIENVLQKNQL